MCAVMLKVFVARLKGLGDRRPLRLIVGPIEVDHLADAKLSEMYTIALRWPQDHSTGIAMHNSLSGGGPGCGRGAQPRGCESPAPEFGILGTTRRKRGFNHIFQAILDPVARNQPWLVQVDDKAIAQFGDDTRALFHQVLATAPKRAEFIYGFLSEEVYYEAFFHGDRKLPLERFADLFL